ncbi:hypothetical protein Syun_029941 [Stephania yunnanensis]|uniref:Embryo sac development arrest 6 n=1 Tax=Stephania yunnanensis TaxID=152371 RepID=A0AAP0E9V8_9MAGN
MSSSRSVVTVGASRKRKEREASFASGSADNRLLAGYLAHEFLTKGTLLGQKWDPARAEAAPVSSRTPKARPGAASKGEIYADVANLLKNSGAQVPGIVNPTQLTRWLQM